MRITALLRLLLLASPVQSLDNGVGLLPPMGARSAPSIAENTSSPTFSA
jgi:hypothetical protein